MGLVRWVLSGWLSRNPGFTSWWDVSVFVLHFLWWSVLSLCAEDSLLALWQCFSKWGSESTCDVVALVVYYKCGPPRPVSDPLERGFNFLYYASPHLIFMGLVSSFPSFLFSVVTSLERSSLITLSKIALLAPPLGLLPSPLTCFSL